MTRERETTGPPFRGAPLVPVLTPPTPIITVRDQDGELLLEVRSAMRGFKLVSQVVASLGVGGLAIAFFNGTMWVPLFAAGVAAVGVLVAVRRSTMTTTLRLRAGELIIEESGFLHHSVRRIPLTDLDVPLVHSWVGDDGPEYALMLPRSGTEGQVAIRLLNGHQQEHLVWLAKVLTTRMLAPATRDPARY